MAASVWQTAPARALDVLSDERLARLAARGDQRAFSALFARHQAGLTRYCRTILRHAADAEDAAQNALVAAHRALEGGTVPMRVKPWLYKIAHNEAISLVRTRRPAEELDEERLPLVADPAEAGEVRHRLGQLMSDLRALTERQREALVLRELCGHDYAEIAQTLGTSEAAAQQTVFEARSALQQFGEGRALACEGVQRAMSECDGMRLRTRRVRAHLRGCESCRTFEAALRARRRDLGLLFPPTGAAGGVLAALGRLLGGGGGEPLLAGLGLKGAAVGLAVLAGGGTVVATSVGGDDAGPPAAVAPATPVSAQTAAPARTSSSSSSGSPAGTRADRARGARDGARGKRERKRRHDGFAVVDGRPGASATVAQAPGAGDGSGGALPDGGDRESARGEPAGGGGGNPAGSGTGRRPVQEVVEDTTAAVGDTVQQTAGAVGETVQQTSGAVQDTVDTVTGTTQDVVDGVTDTVGGVTDSVGGLLGQP